MRCSAIFLGGVFTVLAWPGAARADMRTMQAFRHAHGQCWPRDIKKNDYKIGHDYGCNGENARVLFNKMDPQHFGVLVGVNTETRYAGSKEHMNTSCTRKTDQSLDSASAYSCKWHLFSLPSKPY